MARSSIPSGRRLKAIAVAGGATVGVCLALMLSTASPASAGAFCSGVQLNPSQICWGPAYAGLDYANVVTYNRAGCVAIANGSNQLQSLWRCGPAAGGAIAAEVTIPPNPSANFKGLIQNYGVGVGTFTGHHLCALGNC